jgi:GH15 family glucan-1,4-alpha-glucosidase
MSMPEVSAERDSAGYVDLRSYAAIGDGRTVALVAADGRIDWMPLPTLSSPVPFAALLDAHHGGYVAVEVDGPVRSRRRYVDGTTVLETTLTTPSGTVRVTDAINTGLAGRLPWCELGRRIEGVDGEVTLRAVARPGTCLNRASPWVQQTTHGVVLRVDALTMAVRSDGDSDISWDDESITVEYRTSPGSRAVFGLAATEGEPLFVPSPDAVDEGIDRTVSGWQAWSRSIDYDGPEPDLVRRSALTLKLLMMAATGSVAAAATTSLPERLSGGKNWDYRYAWVRDSAYSLSVLFRFGLREETHAAMSWLLATIHEDGDEPSVMYRLDGTRPDDAPETLDAPGWRGIGPVVTGNRASRQLQLGVFGDVFSIVRLYVDNGNVLDAGTGRTLARIADLACDAWRRKDSGMWELLEQRHYTTSKLGCWQALQHAVHLADLGQIPGDPGRWRTEAQHIRDWVERHCWSPDRGAYLWYPGSDGLDASILLHAISGFDRGPRMSSTIDALDRELGVGRHLYRYSGAGDEEGVFTACSYWMVSALALVGRRDEARARLAELHDTPNDVGILAEMLDPKTGAFLGNLPQALSHLALMHAAITLSPDGGRVG